MDAASEGKGEHMTDRSKSATAIISAVFTALNIIGLLFFTGVMIFQRPHLTEMYMDFGVALPALTQLLISLPSGLFLFAALTLTGLLVVKELMPNKGMTLVLNLVFSVLAIAVTAIIFIILLQPARTIRAAGEQQNTTVEMPPQVVE